MKRTDLVRYIIGHGCKLLREIYWNPANRFTTAVPRHAEIADPVANRICKDLGIPRPTR